MLAWKRIQNDDEITSSIMQTNIKKDQTFKLINPIKTDSKEI